MNSDQATRVRNAIDQGDIEIQPLEGGQFRVKDKYVVDPDEPSCDCPDHEYRNMDCKHIIRVWLELKWGNIQRLDDGEAPDGETDRPPKPDALTPKLGAIPDRIRDKSQWVAWMFDWHVNEDDTGRWTKVPVDVEGGGFASSTDSETWTGFDAAVEYYERSWTDTAGIGFVVSEEDPVVGIDIDDCRDPESGDIDEPIYDLIKQTDSYAEVSPSGTGVRVFVLGTWPLEENQSDLAAGDAHIEVYEWGRYLTVTGHHIDATPTDIQRSDETIDMYAYVMDPSYDK